MAGDYNQQNPDGSWSHVIPNSDGSYSSTLIPTSDYANAGITHPGDAASTAPTGGGGGGLSPDHRDRLRVAGYPDWANPNLSEADYQRISAGAQAAGNQPAGGPAGGTNAELFNSQASQLLISAAQQAAQAAYWASMSKNANDRLAFDEADAVAKNIMNYGNLLANLKGPANAFAYDRALNGMGSAAALAGGKNVPGIIQNPGQVKPMDLNTLLGLVPFTATTQPSAGGTATPALPAGSYNTKNGVKTADQMLAELKNAGWPPAQGGARPSDQDIATQYGQTTGGAVSGGTMQAQAQAQPATNPSAGTMTAQGNMTSGMGMNELLPPGGTPQTQPGPQFSLPGSNPTTNPTSGPNWQGLYNGTRTYAQQLGRQPTADEYAQFAQGYGVPDSVARWAYNGYGDVMKQQGTGYAPWQGFYQGLMNQYNVGTNQYSPDVQKYLDTLPDPNKINARTFGSMDPSQQQLSLAGYQAKGYNTDDITKQMQNSLPTQAGPRFALVQ